VTSRYSLFARTLIAFPILIGLAMTVTGISILRVEPWYAALFVGVGLVAVFVGVFQHPVEIEAQPETVKVKYLLGFTQTFNRSSLKVRRIGFQPGTLLLQAMDRSWRSRLIGSFKVNLAVISNADELLHELGEKTGV
jgi:hypothetical protein